MKHFLTRLWEYKYTLLWCVVFLAAGLYNCNFGLMMMSLGGIMYTTR